MQVSTFQEVHHDLFEVFSEEAEPFAEPLLPRAFQDFPVILDALIEGGQVRFTRPVDRAGFGHGFVHEKTGGECGSRSGGLNGQKVCQGGGWSEEARPGCRPDLAWCAAGYTQRRWDTVGI